MSKTVVESSERPRTVLGATPSARSQVEGLYRHDHRPAACSNPPAKPKKTLADRLYCDIDIREIRDGRVHGAIGETSVCPPHVVHVRTRGISFPVCLGTARVRQRRRTSEKQRECGTIVVDVGLVHRCGFGACVRGAGAC